MIKLRKVGVCPSCKREFIKSKEHRKFCDSECQKQFSQLKRITRYRIHHPKRYKYVRPQPQPITSCIECGGELFHSNRCRKCYEKKFPLKQYCLYCGKPLDKNEESDSLCRLHKYSMGRVWVIPNMQDPFNEWRWVREDRSLILLSNN